MKPTPTVEQSQQIKVSLRESVNESLVYAGDLFAFLATTADYTAIPNPPNTIYKRLDDVVSKMHVALDDMELQLRTSQQILIEKRQRSEAKLNAAAVKEEDGQQPVEETAAEAKPALDAPAADANDFAVTDLNLDVGDSNAEAININDDLGDFAGLLDGAGGDGVVGDGVVDDDMGGMFGDDFNFITLPD